MRVLLIGGTGFIGPAVARDLLAAGHRVAVLHRGRSKPPADVVEIIGDRTDLRHLGGEIDAFAPDVIVDLILSSGKQARAAADVLTGRTGRLVALSSGDVYRACAVLHGLDPGPLQPMPLRENSELRNNTQVYSTEALQRAREAYPWIDTEYDKVAVEREILANAALPATVLRLPMVYGPGDPLHRLATLLRRMDESASDLVIEEKLARWRGPRGYVDNVAAAVVLAAISPIAAGQVYNVAEPDCCSELEWTMQVAEIIGWGGRIVTVPFVDAPAEARLPGNLDQHWIVDSTRIREELGYREPIPRSDALRRTIEWERARGTLNVTRTD